MSGIVAGGRSRLMGCLLGALVLAACRQPKMEDFTPKRLPSIPVTATWVGWVDGGAWIECSFDAKQDANWCTVWDDQVGNVVTRTYFVLQDSGKGVPANELGYAFFSGDFIELADGRVLEPKKFRGRERDPWESPPIDPPRGSPSASSE